MQKNAPADSSEVKGNENCTTFKIRKRNLHHDHPKNSICYSVFYV